MDTKDEGLYNIRNEGDNNPRMGRSVSRNHDNQKDAERTKGYHSRKRKLTSTDRHHHKSDHDNLHGESSEKKRHSIRRHSGKNRDSLKTRHHYSDRDYTKQQSARHRHDSNYNHANRKLINHKGKKYSSHKHGHHNQSVYHRKRKHHASQKTNKHSTHRKHQKKNYNDSKKERSRPRDNSRRKSQNDDKVRYKPKHRSRVKSNNERRSDHARRMENEKRDQKRLQKENGDKKKERRIATEQTQSLVGVRTDLDKKKAHRIANARSRMVAGIRSDLQRTLIKNFKDEDSQRKKEKWKEMQRMKQNLEKKKDDLHKQQEEENTREDVMPSGAIGAVRSDQNEQEHMQEQQKPEKYQGDLEKKKEKNTQRVAKDRPMVVASVINENLEKLIQMGRERGNQQEKEKEMLRKQKIMQNKILDLRREEEQAWKAIEKYKKIARKRLKMIAAARRMMQEKHKQRQQEEEIKRKQREREQIREAQRKERERERKTLRKRERIDKARSQVRVTTVRSDKERAASHERKTHKKPNVFAFLRNNRDRKNEGKLKTPVKLKHQRKQSDKRKVDWQLADRFDNRLRQAERLGKDVSDVALDKRKVKHRQARHSMNRDDGFDRYTGHAENTLMHRHSRGGENENDGYNRHTDSHGSMDSTSKAMNGNDDKDQNGMKLERDVDGEGAGWTVEKRDIDANSHTFSDFFSRWFRADMPEIEKQKSGNGLLDAKMDDNFGEETTTEMQDRGNDENGAENGFQWKLQRESGGPDNSDDGTVDLRLERTVKNADNTDEMVTLQGEAMVDMESDNDENDALWARQTEDGAAAVNNTDDNAMNTGAASHRTSNVNMSTEREANDGNGDFDDSIQGRHARFQTVWIPRNPKFGEPVTAPNQNGSLKVIFFLLCDTWRDLTSFSFYSQGFLDEWRMGMNGE